MKTKRAQTRMLAVVFFFAALTAGLQAQPALSVADKTYREGATAYEAGKIDEAFSLLNKAIEIADREKNTAVIWQAYNYLGSIHAKKLNYDAAADDFKKAFDVALDGGYKQYLAMLTQNIGSIYGKKGETAKADRYFDTAAVYEKGAQLETQAEQQMNAGNATAGIQLYVGALNQYKKTGRNLLCAKLLNFIARLSLENGDCQGALTHYESAIKYGLKTIKDNQTIVDGFSSIGEAFRNNGDYVMAEKVWRKAGALADLEFGMPLAAAIATKRIGEMMLSDKRQPTDALDYFNAALVYAEKAKDKEQQAILHFKRGTTFDLMTKYDAAVSEYEKTLAIADASKLYRWQFIARLNMGSLYSDRGNESKAADNFKKAEAIIAKHDIDDQRNISMLYVCLGRLSVQQKKAEAAAAYYEKALRLAREQGDSVAIAETDLSLGKIAFDQQRYDEAIASYSEAYELVRGNNDASNTRLNAAIMLGEAYVLKGVPAQAERLLLEAVSHIETISNNVDDRDFLDNENSSPYLFLVQAYVSQQKTMEAFGMLERMNARYFRSQFKKKGFAAPGDAGINAFRKTLRDDAAVITCAKTIPGKAVVLFADNSHLAGYEKSDAGFGAALKGNDAIAARASIEKSRGMRVAKHGPPPTLDNFAMSVEYFRTILSSGSASELDRRMMNEIGRKLYEYVFRDIEPLLKGKKDLYIMPSSILAYIPFETFVMPDGRYLVEQYDIHYIQSLAVQNILESREHPEKRAPIMAFGNPVYEKITYKNEEDEAQAVIDYFHKTGGNIYESELANYVAYGYGPDKWSTLPATAGEVGAIKTIFSDAAVFTGKEARRERLITMSTDGSLGSYRMLHFATHGLVIPENPQLSALVLSQEKGANDLGYLSMHDIASLKLHADFVNLSACETGLGRFYLTEGIVGLTQAFMLAGANAVSVSLWSIQDESTRAFMTDFYGFVHSGMPYTVALCEAKRKFIKEGRYAHPYYWAPFVYYGSNAKLALSSPGPKAPGEARSATGETMTDIDGNIYTTVKIGNQIWTAENLRTTRFTDGTRIPVVANDSAWDCSSSPALCYFKNATNRFFIDKYGALYNWYAASTRKLAPAGWHLPSDAEWDALRNYLIANGYNYDGTKEGDKTGKALAARTDWDESTFDGCAGNDLSKNNACGFSALPGGSRVISGYFSGLGSEGVWWSSSCSYENQGAYRTEYGHDYSLRYENLQSSHASKECGFSVRLVKD